MRIDPNLRDSNVRVSKLAAEIWETIERSETDEYAEILDALARVSGQATTQMRKLLLGVEEEQGIEEDESHG